MKSAVLVLAAASLAVAALPGCKSGPTEEDRLAGYDGEHMHREVRSYHVVYSEHRGRVGYMKVYDVVEGGGPAYQWKYVYDLDWKELGFIDQFGTAYLNQPYTSFTQDAQPRTIRFVRLPADSAQRNAMRMLGIDPALDDVSFPVATDGDVAPAQAK